MLAAMLGTVLRGVRIGEHKTARHRPNVASAPAMLAIPS